MHKIIETITNHILPSHAKFSVFTSKYTGKLLSLNIDGTLFQFKIHQSGLIAFPHTTSDSQIKMNQEALLGSIGIKHPDASVIIDGNHNLGTAFMQLFSIRKINTSSLLQSTLPKKLAIIAEEALHIFNQQRKHTVDTLCSQIHHYLVYEKGLCIDQHESDEQYKRILELKWSIDHLKGE